MSILDNPETHRAIALKHRAFFHQYYLDPERLPPPHQLEMFQFIDSTNLGLILEPRGHIKTTTVGFSLPIQEICRDVNVRILIVQKTSDAAKKTVRQIRDALSTNAKLRRDFPIVFEKDTEQMIYLRRTKNLRDPTIEAVGTGGAITGGHFDLIIFDDPVDEENVKTAYQRDLVKQWFYGTINLLKEPWSRIIGIGTRKNYADLYADIKRNPLWAVLERKAIIKYPISWEFAKNPEGRIIGIANIKGEHAVLWPAKWPITTLLLEKQNIGSLLFNREMQNEPLSDEDSPFKYAWLQFYDELPVDLKGRWGAVDPAISPDKGADFFALLTIAIDRQNNIYIEPYIHDHLTFPEQARTVSTALRQRDYVRFGIEANAYQIALQQHLQTQEVRPIVPIKNTRSKEERILSLAPYFESKRVFLRKDMHALIEQYVQFPKSEHDDLLDALEMAVRLAVGEPRGTAAFKLI
jgi:predicted phage terminase large subunit-like protein